MIYDNTVFNIFIRHTTFTYKAMGEIFLMKTLKGLLSIFCYFGTGAVVVEEYLPKIIKTGAIELVDISPTSKVILFYLLLVFWAIKIVWFTYDKFYLEANERKLGMKKTEEEIIDMKEGHEKGGLPPNPRP